MTVMRLWGLGNLPFNGLLGRDLAHGQPLLGPARFLVEALGDERPLYIGEPGSRRPILDDEED